MKRELLLWTFLFYSIVVFANKQLYNHLSSVLASSQLMIKQMNDTSAIVSFDTTNSIADSLSSAKLVSTNNYNRNYTAKNNINTITIVFIIIIILIFIWFVISNENHKKEKERKKVSSITPNESPSPPTIVIKPINVDYYRQEQTINNKTHATIAITKPSIEKVIDQNISIYNKKEGIPFDSGDIKVIKDTLIPIVLNNHKNTDSLYIEISLKLEEIYKQGIIPIQEKVYVKYTIRHTTKNGYYAFYIAPQKDTPVYPYRRRKNELRGYSEEKFENEIRKAFNNETNYSVLGDVSIQFAKGCHPYEPDIAIIEKSNKYGIRIDVEIDEPYSGYDKSPIHYIGCGDEFRDNHLTHLGWIVIRFSEKQIYNETSKCIYYIKSIINQIDPNFHCDPNGEFPTLDKCWTEIQAKKMAASQYREILLKHTFNFVENPSLSPTKELSVLEKTIASETKPILFKTSIPTNLDKSSLFFLDRDKRLSFDPKEHVYVYDGRIKLHAVSNIIDLFFTPFDSLAHAERVAKKRGISPCEVLEEWDCKAQEAREIGTFLHAQIETLLSHKSSRDYTHFSYEGEYIRKDKDISIIRELQYFRDFISENLIIPYRTEWHIYDLNLKVAGTIDLLCRNGNNFDIYDWKRSQKASPEETIWGKGINGLEHIPDISFYHYAIQQNLYKYILEKNYNLSIENMFIVILHPYFKSYKKYRIPDLNREIDIIRNYIKAHDS